MYRIGITEDLVRPWPAADTNRLDLGRRLADLDVEIVVLPVPRDRILATPPADCDSLLLGDCSIRSSQLGVASARLKHIARFGKGYDDIDLGEARRLGIVVTSVANGGDTAMATGVITLMLALATRLFDKTTVVRANRADWGFPFDQAGTGLKQRRLGIVGFGRIGREVARLAGPFGLRIAAYDPGWNSQAAEILAVSRSELSDLFRTSDFISINCALTEATKGLVSRELMSLMKPSAYLINTGRGAVVDERALADLLDKSVMAGAALDVFSTEPLPKDHPLLFVKNLVLTPHSIGVSDEMYIEYMDDVERSLRAVIAGAIPAGAI